MALSFSIVADCGAFGFLLHHWLSIAAILAFCSAV